MLRYIIIMDRDMFVEGRGVIMMRYIIIMERDMFVEESWLRLNCNRNSKSLKILQKSPRNPKISCVTDIHAVIWSKKA